MIDFTLVKNELNAGAALAEEALSRYFGKLPADLSRIDEAEAYSVFAGGKRIRPFLVFSFCRLFGGTDEAAAPFAAALECIHTYSLIHDDLPCMDNDDYRRGRLTSHKKFDEATAVLAGDALLTKAFGIAAGNPCVSSEVALEAVKLLAESAGDGGMIGGQILDMASEKGGIRKREELVRLQSLKTGCLIRAGALLGCLAAGKTLASPEAKAAAKYADGIGLSFQIIDDILDVEGDPGKVGKTLGKDADSHKVTFLSFDSIPKARAEANAITEEAKHALLGFEGNEPLLSLADYLLIRES